MYVSVRDAVSRVASLVLSKRPPQPPRHWYLEPEPGTKRPGGLIPGAGLEEAIDAFDARTSARNAPTRIVN